MAAQREATHPRNRLLVVDDHRPILRAMHARLEHNGYDVDTATDGATALTIALARRPTHALLDINMPGLDGFGLAERLQDAIEGIQITYLTASQDPELLERAEDLGAVGFFQKPVDSGELLAHLEACHAQR